MSRASFVCSQLQSRSGSCAALPPVPSFHRQGGRMRFLTFASDLYRPVRAAHSTPDCVLRFSLAQGHPTLQLSLSSAVRARLQRRFSLFDHDLSPLSAPPGLPGASCFPGLFPRFIGRAVLGVLVKHPHQVQQRPGLPVRYDLSFVLDCRHLPPPFRPPGLPGIGFFFPLCYNLVKMQRTLFLWKSIS